jgi:hypothetical protein
MGSRSRVGMGLSYRSASLYMLAESIPRHLNSLKVPSLVGWYDNPIPARFLAPMDCSKISVQQLLHSQQETCCQIQQKNCGRRYGNGFLLKKISKVLPSTYSYRWKMYCSTALFNLRFSSILLMF